MNVKTKIILAGTAGLVVGYGSAFTIFLTSWTALIAWGIAALVVGLFARDRNEALYMGASFGLLLSVSFLMGGFRGDTSHILGFALLTAVVAVISVLCGAIGAWMGYGALKGLLKR